MQVSSAGVRAVVGASVHPGSRAELTPWGLHGAPAEWFAARQLDRSVVEGVDLVLGATPQHRGAVLERFLELLGSTFSLREFARLAALVDPRTLPADLVQRSRVLVGEARRLRGAVAAADDDRIPDPIGGTPEEFRRATELTFEAVRSLMDVLAPRPGETPRKAAPTDGPVIRRGRLRIGSVVAARDRTARMRISVVGVEIDVQRAEALAAGRVPFYEPGFDELLNRSLASGRLEFVSDMAGAVGAQIHFMCVGTPQKRGEYAADLRYVEAATESLVGVLRPGELVAGKSTVPVGTAAWLAKTITDKAPGALLAWNPEFLREGFAVQDTLHPDRLVYGLPDGADGVTAARMLDEVYAPIVAAGTPKVVTRLCDGGDGEDRRELVPGHEDLVRQRDGGTVRGDRRGCEAAGRCDRSRRPDRAQVPQRRVGFRWRVPAQGHPGVHGAGG